MKTGILLLLLLILPSLGCDTDRPDSDFFSPDDVGTLVVDATLTVGEPLARVLLSRTVSPGDFYDRFAARETLASVTVTVRNTQEVISYTEIAPGSYVAVSAPEVLPETTYDLRVATAHGEVVTASTTTPKNFAMASWLLLDNSGQSVWDTLGTYELGDGIYDENRLVYTDGLLEGRFTTRSGQGFQVGVESLDKDSDFVIDPAFFDEEDFASLDRVTSSPGFEALDGKLRLPWFVIFFQGRYKLKVFAVDENWWELILSLPENTPGVGGQIGDSFARPNFNVNGGIGLFGSASVDSIGFFVLPRP
jgi:hypothetical protein